MNRTALLLGLLGLLLGGACRSQDSEPASPTSGNAERGRILLSVLGPKPHDAAGISPLQQQELDRRVRCAATRQEIQDQLDFEAAGSTGFYSMGQLRGIEKQICTPPPQVTLLQPVAQPSPQPLPQPRATPPKPLPPPASSVTKAPPPAPPQQPVRPATTVPAYTPSPKYPPDDIAAGHEGVVLVELVINADGSVKAAAVAKSSNFPSLDAAALDAARTWRIPAAAGKTIHVPLTFSAH